MSKDIGGNTYELTYLKKAGIRFDLNMVDSIYQKGLGFNFFLLSFLCVLLIFIKDSSFVKAIFDNSSYYLIFIFSLFIYLCIQLFKYLYFYYLRKRLRNDINPIIVEAYAIVIVSKIKDKKLSLNKEKAVVLYKECGTEKPRFFTSAIKPFCDIDFNYEQVARVFIDRNNMKNYSIDDETDLATISKKKKGFFKEAVINVHSKVDIDTDTTNT